MGEASLLAPGIPLDDIRRALRADVAFVLRVEEAATGRLRVVARSGRTSEHLPDEILAPSGSLLAQVLAGTHPGRLPRLPLMSGGMSGGSRRLGPSLVVPVMDPVLGDAVLVVGRRFPAKTFDNVDLDYVRHLAGGAGGADAEPALRLETFGGEGTFRQAFEVAAAGMSLVDADLRYRWVNAPLCLMLGRDRDELLDLAATETVHPEHVDRAIAFYDRLRGGSGDAVRDRLLFRRPDGAAVWAELGGSFVSNGVRPPLFLVQQFDVTAEQDLADGFAYQAMHDDLTGLANRMLLRDRLHALLAHALRGGSRAVAFYLDIDRFKSVNDRFGHAAGDRVLAATASRLTAVVRAGDTVARVGGDEFVVAGEATGTAEASQMAERIAAALRPRVDIGSAWRRLPVSVSIGIALNGPLDTPEDLVARADRALLEAKGLGKPHVVSSEMLY